VAADGPVRLTLAAWLERAGVRGPGRGGMVGRRLADLSRTAQLQDVLDGPWWTEDPAIPDGWAFAGISPEPPSPDACPALSAPRSVSR
jgi:hypothetical protein